MVILLTLSQFSFCLVLSDIYLTPSEALHTSNFGINKRLFWILNKDDLASVGTHVGGEDRPCTLHEGS